MLLLLLLLHALTPRAIVQLLMHVRITLKAKDACALRTLEHHGGRWTWAAKWHGRSPAGHRQMAALCQSYNTGWKSRTSTLVHRNDTGLVLRTHTGQVHKQLTGLETPSMLAGLGKAHKSCVRQIMCR